MKRHISGIVFSILIAGSTVAAGESGTAPVVTSQAFEPPLSECFDTTDKFRQPALLATPTIRWPSMRRSGPAPQVVLLVQLDERGYAKRLSVLSSNEEAFSLAAIEGLKRARWQTAKSVWFYVDVNFAVP